MSGKMHSLPHYIKLVNIFGQQLPVLPILVKIILRHVTIILMNTFYNTILSEKNSLFLDPSIHTKEHLKVKLKKK